MFLVSKFIADFNEIRLELKKSRSGEGKVSLSGWQDPFAFSPELGKAVAEALSSVRLDLDEAVIERDIAGLKARTSLKIKDDSSAEQLEYIYKLFLAVTGLRGTQSKLKFKPDRSPALAESMTALEFYAKGRKGVCADVAKFFIAALLATGKLTEAQLRLIKVMDPGYHGPDQGHYAVKVYLPNGQGLIVDAMCLAEDLRGLGRPYQAVIELDLEEARYEHLAHRGYVLGLKGNGTVTGKLRAQTYLLLNRLFQERTPAQHRSPFSYYNLAQLNYDPNDKHDPQLTVKEARNAYALEMIRNAVSISPQDPYAWCSLANILKDQEHLTEAEEACRKALSLEERAFFYAQLAELAQLKGEDAAALVQKALDQMDKEWKAEGEHLQVALLVSKFLAEQRSLQEALAFIQYQFNQKQFAWLQEHPDLYYQQAAFYDALYAQTEKEEYRQAWLKNLRKAWELYHKKKRKTYLEEELLQDLKELIKKYPEN